MSQEFEQYLKAQKIAHQVAAANYPKQNSVTERMKRTLYESARPMFSQPQKSKKFWAAAINTAAYLRNRLPTSTHDATRYERWYGRKPQLSALRVFRCTAYALTPDHAPTTQARRQMYKADLDWMQYQVKSLSTLPC